MIHMTSWQTAVMGKVGLLVCLFLFASACGGTSEIVEVTTNTTTVPTTTTTVPTTTTTVPTTTTMTIAPTITTAPTATTVTTTITTAPTATTGTTTTVPTTTTVTATTTVAPTITTAPTTTVFESPIPDIGYFADNKSDQFLVDFEDIIAGHPFVGQRSPKPHNDAQVYFSNSDPRWEQAVNPSDYPAVYAVADGIISMAEGENAYYNVRDKTNYQPPWYHVIYGFNLHFANKNGEKLMFHYSLEPYITLHDKPRDFYKQFILVEDGQRVRKGDVLAYMYISPFEERITGPNSAHIAFNLMFENKGPWDVFPPAIFTEEVVNQFHEIYSEPREGWDSSSYGNDWERARGLPPAMGWMIGASENPFTNIPLDVLIYDGIKDQGLDGSASISPTSLAFQSADLIQQFAGTESILTDQFTMGENWRAAVGVLGGPIQISFITTENYGGSREGTLFSMNQGMSFQQNITPTMSPGDYQLRISNSGGWPWAIGIASAESNYSMPGENLPNGFCPPNCPDLP